MPSGAAQSDDPFSSDAHVPVAFSRPEVPAGLLESLTPNQQRAVRHLGGPALVLAGPGSGKTRVITRRIAALLAQGVRPYNVLAVTFTNKAAAEMRTRVSLVLGESNFRGLTVSTFHSLCVRLLRRYAEVSGLVEQGWLKADFTIVDSDDQSKMIKEAVKGAQLSTENFPPRTVLAAISGSKNQLIDEHTFAARASDFTGVKSPRLTRTTSICSENPGRWTLMIFCRWPCGCWRQASEYGPMCRITTATC